MGAGGSPTCVRRSMRTRPPRPLAEIDAELKGVTDRILTLIAGLSQ